MNGPDDRAKFRAQRMTIRKARLGEPDVDLSPISGAEAISLVRRLTQTSYALSGQPWPTYTRAEIPCKFVPWPARR